MSSEYRLQTYEAVNVRGNSANHLYTIKIITALVLFLEEHHMLMRGFRIDTHLQNTFGDDHSNKTQTICVQHL